MQLFPDGYSADRRAVSPGYFFGQEFDVTKDRLPPSRCTRPN